MPIRPTLFALALAVALALPAGAEPDPREQVELPPPMRAYRVH